MADTQSILQLGIEAARAGDKAEARELFRLVTREDPNNAQGWLWLAGVAEDREEKRAALERVTQIDPSNDLARKGLAALGGAAAGGAAASGAAAMDAPAQTPTASRAPAGQDMAQDPFSDAAAPGGRRRPNVYEQPEQVGSYVPPDFGDDDYDLSEYQSQPRAAADDAEADDRDAVVVVEDEEPRRRGMGLWLPAMAVLLLLLGVLGFLLFRTFTNTDTATVDPNTSAVAVNPDVSAAADPNAASAAADASSEATGLLPGSSAAADASAAAGSDAAAVPATSDPAAASAEAAASTPAEAAASTPAEAAASTPAEAAASTPAEAAPSAPAEAAPSAPAEAAASTPAEAVPSAPAEAVPSAPAEAVPSAPVDVAAANPAIVSNDQILRGGNFAYGFTGLSNVATGSYGGSPPARGRYLIVLVTVGNVGSTPQAVPDGFFVVKDAQGRVSDFNRAASVDYINRFGGTGPRGAGDYAADAQLAPGSLLGSMPLLFDVAADATDLVVFSRENPAQGFRVQP